MGKASATVQITGLEDVISQLERRHRNVKEELSEAMTAGGVVFAEAAKANATPISKAIATGVRVKVTIKRGGVEVKVGSASPLSHLFEFGVEAHPIKPKERQALLLGGGKFAGRVKHPGMSAKPWLRPAFDNRKEEAQEAVRRKLAQALMR